MRSFQSNMEVMITMKKLFKKSIACLIAVLMVVSTMPFTAITAQAADTSALLSAMQSFEAKMDGSVYTNMDTAYNAYVAASKAYDAAYYGGDASVDVTTPATNLNNAVSQMTKTNLTPYTANNPRPAFNSGTVPENAYNGVLYTNKKNSNEAFSVDISDSDVKFQVGYSETVLMYSDSNNAPSMPVMFVVRKNGTGQTRSRYVYSVYPTTSSGSIDTHTELVLNDMWYSSGSSKWNFQNEYGNTSYRVGHNYDTRNAGLEMRTAWAPSDYVAYANVLKFNTKSSWGSEYYKSYKNLNWNAYVGGGNLSKDLHGTGAVNDNSSIYVINYLPLKNAITADANSTARQNVASYKEGGMSTYLAGCLLAAGLNPNNYSYSTDLAGQVSQCASDISTAVTKFTTAPTADNTSNYPALRNAFDYSGELAGFNNSTYSVREAYNGGVNNGFTQASYDNFKAKYEAAQNVMKAVATTGYVNDGFAGDAATALLTAFNALQHEHSFTGAYVNNGDGTHSQKCAFYDKCQTSSTGVDHSCTPQVTTQPTCTTAGVTTYTCVCGYSYTTNEPAATDHDWGDWKSNGDGTHTRTCKNNASHTEDDNCSGGEATCSALAICDECKSTYGSLNENNHKHTHTVPAKASTCTEAGWEEYTYCEDCKKVVGEKVDLELAKHEYVVTSKDDDKHTLTCQNCPNTYDEAHKWGEYVVTKPATCTKNAVETATCTVEGCGATTSREKVDTALGHTYGAWKSNKDGTHSKYCTRNCGEEGATVTEDCSVIGDGVCDDCGYKAFDISSYTKAVEEYNSIKGNDFTTKYTEESRTTYQELVNTEIAKKDTFASQEQVDAAAAAILSAKTELVYAQVELEFIVVDNNGVESEPEPQTVAYGTPVTFTKDADNIAKWIVTTQKGNVETKVATSQTTYTMIATEPATVYVYLTEEKNEALEYSKVSFIGKNGAVSSVQYVAKGEKFETSNVQGDKIPFYEFVGWNKASVTADGSDIEVKAVYEFIGKVDDKCNVHYEGFEGGVKEYTYDSFVYLFGAEDKKLALASDAEGKNIITYLNENAFYAPHTKDIYVIEVNSPQQASIGITGSYMQTNNDGTRTAAFNCKFYVPDGTYEVVEYGMIATSSKGSMKIKAGTASGRGEYCIKISSKEVKSISGQAYLTYRTSEGKFETIYSTTTVTQNLR